MYASCLALFNEGGGNLLFKAIGSTKSVDVVDLGSIGRSGKEGFEKGTNWENVSSCTSSSHCDIETLVFHLIKNIGKI
jgi:hypothetical protein